MEYSFKMTEKRKQMLSCLQMHTTYQSAQEIRSHLKEVHKLDASNDFVYSNLQLFAKEGLIHEFILDQERQYFYNESTGHFAMCTTCHRVEPLEMECPVHAFKDTYGYIHAHRFEMFVTCPTCIQKGFSK